MSTWLIVLLVILALIVIVSISKRSMERDNRPMTQEEIDREHEA